MKSSPQALKRTRRNADAQVGENHAVSVDYTWSPGERALLRFLEREGTGIRDYLDELNARSPFRQG